VIPKRNPEVLARTIEKLLYLTEDKKVKMKEAAIERIQANFNLAKQEKEFLAFYSN
jgi:colanic acid/amylovoran biosynthesis glycosyltransferase